MNVFDVRVYAIRRRLDRRRPFEVRWHAAGRTRSRSFLTRRLADSYRAELVRAARKGLEFDLATGEPTLWSTLPTPDPTWYQLAVAYVDMKWPCLAPHSRASVAEALATLTPVLTRATTHRPPARSLRAALYRHAFNPHQRNTTMDPATASALAWLERASLRLQDLHDPRVIRRALEALTVRLDGRRAAANTISRKHAVFHKRSATPPNSAFCPPTRSPRCTGRHPPPTARRTRRPSPPPPRCTPSSPASPRSGRS
jgi:hypothetical protein